jgi:F-type H+-transporting ATPase subunit b
MIELDWTTFFLQILNFLVLLWLLHWLLYKPVFAVIERRKAELVLVQVESDRLRAEGQALVDRYEHRLAEWEQEKAAARARLAEDIEAERARLLTGVGVAVAMEREKARVLDERRQRDERRHLEEIALAQGTRFVSRLLERLAGQDLESRLVSLTLEDLRELPAPRREAMRQACGQEDLVAVANSTFPLEAEQRAAVAQQVESVIGRPLDWKWAEDRSLLSGLRITIGPWVLSANLRDELTSFAEVDNGEQSAVIH